MNTFTLTHRENAGNLHITITGEFNGQCAWKLLSTVDEYYRLPGRIFVQTENITTIYEKGLALYRQLYNEQRIPLKNFYFKGELGFKIALNGQRILLPKKSCQSTNKRLKNNFFLSTISEKNKKTALER